MLKFLLKWFPPRQCERQLVLFDGVCGLCDRCVQFLLKEDHGCVLKFAPIQSAAGSQTLQHRADLQNLTTLIYVRKDAGGDENIYTRSEAILRIFADIGGAWRIVSWMRVIPAFLLDPIYNWIAKNRYAWFGKADACRVPTPEMRARFIDT